MPEYSYHCIAEECGHEESHFCTMSGYEDLHASMEGKACPKCGEPLYRDFSPSVEDKAVQINSNNIYEQVYQKRPDGSIEVMPASRRLRDGNRKILPPLHKTDSGFRR